MWCFLPFSFLVFYCKISSIGSFAFLELFRLLPLVAPVQSLLYFIHTKWFVSMCFIPIKKKSETNILAENSPQCMKQKTRCNFLYYEVHNFLERTILRLVWIVILFNWFDVPRSGPFGVVRYQAPLAKWNLHIFQPHVLHTIFRWLPRTLPQQRKWDCYYET